MPLLIAASFLGTALFGASLPAWCAGPSAGEGPPPTAVATQEIPPDYLTLYRSAGAQVDVDWRFLAAIGGQESNHGRAPGASVVNSSGCAGPMQLGVGGACGDFFGTYALDGDGDGELDVYSPADAVFSAANGLRRGKGAPARGGTGEEYAQAARAYYGLGKPFTDRYAREVMARAERYGFGVVDDDGVSESTAEVAGCSGDDVRQEIVAVLREELALGLAEEGGEDRGPPLSRYWTSEGIPWCAAFATWVWREAGVPIRADAYSGYFIEWARERGTWKEGAAAQAEPGDAVVYGPSAGSRTEHVDIVEQVLSDGSLIVVGGNVSDGVRRRGPVVPVESLSSPRRKILGYASPVGGSAADEGGSTSGVVWIQAGHEGPREPGYRAQTGSGHGPFGSEIAFTMRLSDRLTELLRAQGIDARRMPGRVTPLGADGAAFVSLHHGAPGEYAGVAYPAAGSTENYYEGDGVGLPRATPYPGGVAHRAATAISPAVEAGSRGLAVRISEELSGIFTPQNDARTRYRGIVTDNRRMTNFHGFYRVNTGARVIVELGAADLDAGFLRRTDVIAESLARAIASDLGVDGVEEEG